MTLGEAKQLIELDLERAQISAAFLGKNLAFDKGYLISKLALAYMKINELSDKIEKQKEIINELNKKTWQ